MLREPVQQPFERLQAERECLLDQLGVVVGRKRRRALRQRVGHGLDGHGLDRASRQHQRQAEDARDAEPAGLHAGARPACRPAACRDRVRCARRASAWTGATVSCHDCCLHPVLKRTRRNVTRAGVARAPRPRTPTMYGSGGEMSRSAPEESVKILTVSFALSFPELDLHGPRLAPGRQELAGVGQHLDAPALPRQLRVPDARADPGKPTAGGTPSITISCDHGPSGRSAVRTNIRLLRLGV